VLDGSSSASIEGRSQFYPLHFRRDWPYFLRVRLARRGREDLRDRPLLERKRRLRAIMPRIPSRLLCFDHVRERGTALYREACGRDLEGIVGKWARAHYLTDADIRQRDSRYRTMQDSALRALRALVRLLRDNAPDDEVGRDTFLREV
jgi:hypothetical protein